ncbi:sigma 54-interacting transcriptional regulator [Salicibibacter cibarius]|uniref:Sigma 54-interacting transcriptional regulator n=1 Tax=Salicibibacter cibarius TaxID=2743000 RepID=A0A7T6Z175_9BACI|nr:sigma 54-interacting transcriptional regulator [Salicibibacter cibarius]QQK74992.1 sigma 54-interacting transcriptional regulator [Salicibibacter cibarius]
MISNDHVKQWMNLQPVTLSKEDTLPETLVLFSEITDKELPVVEDGHLLGVVTLQDCVAHLDEGKVSAIMKTDYNAVSHDFSLNDKKTSERPLYVLHEKNGALEGVVGHEEMIAYYEYVREQEKDARQTIEWLKLGFDTAYEGVAIVDEKGIIQLFNEAYSRYVGVSKEEALGRPAADVIENSRLPAVLKTGVPERSQPHRLQGQELVVHRLPIWKDGRVIGAVGILVYEGISEIRQVLQRMERLQTIDKQSDKQMSREPTAQGPIHFDDIIGESPGISKIKRIGRKASKAKATVLITGESGVGKEPFARAIHEDGNRTNGPFVAVNCAAIPENLLESELFGYVQGAFTGTRNNGKPGKVELASGGTLFLDEIGDMPLTTQAKILRVLQEKEVDRVGGTNPIPVDFRLIAATNKDLKKQMEEDKFREDLFYRLHVIPLHIPPLRDRKQDIPLIIADRLPKLSEENETQETTIEKEVLERMFQYDWPGNVRELLNVLEQMFHLCEDDHIRLEDLPDGFSEHNQVSESLSEWQERKQKQEERFERKQIEKVLGEVDGNKSKAAKRLGISRATLYNKLSRFS